MDNHLYADVIIPVALPGSYTYMVREEHHQSIGRGSSVVVQFGSRRLYTGIVARLHNNPPAVSKVKEIVAVTGDGRLIDENQFSLWNWISEYYICTMGEVMYAALPSALKIESRSIITLSDPAWQPGPEDPAASIVYRILMNDGSASMDKLPAEIENESVMNVVRRMIGMGAVVAGEKPVERFRPREEQVVALNPSLDDQGLHKLLDSMKRSPAKLKILETYLSIIPGDVGNPYPEIEKGDLVARSGASAGPLSEMVARGIFIQGGREINRLGGGASELSDPLALSKIQEAALNQIRNSFKSKDVTLLKGVTSSGKTELYIHLISETIKRGKQVLFLLPEIALTSQMINRLKRHFGEAVGVYHSRFSDNERVEVWRRTASESPDDGYQIILGVRSSLFLPYRDLGLIIVDEEHENSYKQSDPAPRYHARDSAIMLARFHKAHTLLGSATPSVETMYNATTGKYALVELGERFGKVMMPEMILADTRDAYRRKIMVSHFTPQLVKAIEDALGRSEQVVLFRNRRGFAPVIICRECGWIPECRSCSVSMTYHKGLNKLKCHYCGFTINIPSTCPSCGSGELLMKGFGTEKIEDELKILFPEARIERMDLDTTRKKGAFDRLITNLERGNTDILIGTQMISKGLDFENLTVVGILNIDNMLHFPDFRSHEKCFQMIEQVSGRAGRRSKQGRVVVQTFDPHHQVMIQALHHDYDGMYQSQLAERREFNYPPFTRLIRIYIRHRHRTTVSECAAALAAQLRISFGNRVLGPEFPLIARLQSYYIMSVIIKIERERPARQAKKIITGIINQVINSGAWSGIRIYTDVDPL